MHNHNHTPMSSPRFDSGLSHHSTGCRLQQKCSNRQSFLATHSHRRSLLGVEGHFASICAWCEDQVELTAAAVAAGFTPSHGICQDCAKRRFGDITEESFATEAVFIDLTDRRAP